MKTPLEAQRIAFAKAIADDRPLIKVTGALLHDLTQHVDLDADIKADNDTSDEALAVSRTLKKCGKGRRAVVLSRGVAEYLDGKQRTAVNDQQPDGNDPPPVDSDQSPAKTDSPPAKKSATKSSPPAKKQADAKTKA